MRNREASIRKGCSNAAEKKREVCELSNHEVLIYASLEKRSFLSSFSIVSPRSGRGG